MGRAGARRSHADRRRPRAQIDSLRIHPSFTPAGLPPYEYVHMHTSICNRTHIDDLRTHMHMHMHIYTIIYSIGCRPRAEIDRIRVHPSFTPAGGRSCTTSISLYNYS